MGSGKLKRISYNTHDTEKGKSNPTFTIVKQKLLDKIDFKGKLGLTQQSKIVYVVK